MSKVKQSDKKGFRTYYNKKKIDDQFDNLIEPYSSFYKNQKILDIGCNSGIVTYALSFFAKGCIGVEQGGNSWTHIEEVTEKHAGNTVKFVNSSLESFLQGNADFDMVFACQVLYYLSPSEVDLLKSKLISQCSKAMLISSETRAMGHKSYDVKDNGLHTYKNIVKLLEECGFKTEIGQEYKSKTLRGNKFHWIPVKGTKE
jgi:predicted TPR repeat methyltransferase